MFSERARKPQPCPVISYEKSRYNKADRRQALAKDGGLGRQAGKQEDRRTGRDCRAPENGKLPGLYNQLGTFDQPEPRHQLLWDNRQPSEA